MGVDAKLLTSHIWTVEDVYDLIVDMFDKDAKVENTDTPDYTIITFKYGTENRRMNVFRTGNVYGGFPSISISVGAWGNADVFMRAIAERLGGFYQPQDYEEIYQLYPSPFDEENNHLFYIKQAAKKGVKLNEISNLKEWYEKNK